MAQKNKKGQSSLLSFFSSEPIVKKQRKVEDDDKEEEEIEKGFDVSPSTSSQKNCNIVTECEDNQTTSECSSTLIKLINERDPINGPALALAHISDGPFQPKDLTFPSSNGRKFRTEWYGTFPWLEYSPGNDKAYCFTCRTFYRSDTKCKADDAFTVNGFCNWKKAVQTFENHQKCNSHVANSVKLVSLRESKKSGSVAEKVNTKYSKDVQQNRLYLKSLCESLIFCGRQAIALRGHDETTDSNNRGNFLELMELRSKDSEVIQQLFVERQKNFHYSSPTYQNELLSIIGEQIKHHIAKQVKEAKIFAVIADETQDIAKHEQVAVVLRYVNESFEVHESFVGFYRVENTDGETLAELIKNVLVSLDLDIQNLRGQCYDGASNMRGPYKGVAARILQESPTAMYIHCNAHILNLCIVSCFTSVTSIRNTFFVLQSIYNFIEKSTKRHAVFEMVQKSSKSFHGGATTLKSLSDTRWACRIEAVRALLDNFEETLAALDEISATDHDAGGQANALRKSMQDFSFLFDLLLLRRVLMQCDILSKTLQSTSVTYEVVKSVKNSTVEVLQSFRSEEFFLKLFNHSSDLANKCGFKGPELPRKRNVPAKLGGGTKVPYETAQEFYKNTVLYPVIDILTTEIESRLEENNLNVLNNLSEMLGANEVNKDSISFVCEYYKLDFERCLSELQCFYGVEEVKNKSIQERASVFTEKRLKCAFPLTFDLFKLYFTIPMNSASCERSFSCLRRLKTYCRNTTGQERLSSLALMAIERDVQVDLDKVIDEFNVQKGRRLHFL